MPCPFRCTTSFLTLTRQQQQQQQQQQNGIQWFFTTSRCCYRIINFILALETLKNTAETKKFIYTFFNISTIWCVRSRQINVWFFFGHTIFSLEKGKIQIFVIARVSAFYISMIVFNWGGNIQYLKRNYRIFRRRIMYQ